MSEDLMHGEQKLLEPLPCCVFVTCREGSSGAAGEASPRDGARWLPWALLLLCVPGSLSLRGPNNVTGTVGGSLSVQCRYQKEYEAFNKYWCRQPCLPLFSETVETSASRREVRRGRVSVLDHPGNLTFTVTLTNLTANDAGKYRCGISTLLMEEGIPGFLPEPFFQVQVFVSPASSSRSSAKMRGPPSQDPGPLLSSVHFLLLIFLKAGSTPHPILLISLGYVSRDPLSPLGPNQMCTQAFRGPGAQDLCAESHRGADFQKKKEENVESSELHVGGQNTSVITTKAREDEKVWPSAQDSHS
ncbi:protein CD300H-like [Myotis yumanensis]|uniref:protein CD300H-like n=1 Tax=Myotis yumanensis TaxID=159337 RepID=UPI0038D4A0E9